MAQRTIDPVTKKTSMTPATPEPSPAMSSTESPALRALRERQQRELAEAMERDAADREHQRRLAVEAAERRRVEEEAAEKHRIEEEAAEKRRLEVETVAAASATVSSSSVSVIPSDAARPTQDVAASAGSCGAVVQLNAEADFFELLGRMKRSMRTAGGVPDQVFLELSAVLSRAARGQSLVRPGSVSSAPIELQDDDVPNNLTEEAQKATNMHTNYRDSSKLSSGPRQGRKARKYSVAQHIFESLPLRLGAGDGVDVSNLSHHRFFAIQSVRRRVSREAGPCRTCLRGGGPFAGCFFSRKELTQEEQDDGMLSDWNASCGICRWLGRHCEF
ncbi:hypothetical protein BJ508DRAFT_316122 [Ascobolus immersus RN42]|uniref:Uncharacterized protein n=1 Tax=Ascobolus immersus RN42 TaxID=1160509 RepID=A0A3N4HBX6_ASCIM|nr:hypothetical protein BJ508DRAFT_316120 [Ascobolus immersus RN42]RPA70886.1 hypothetical protein BJ508DRAFT_316122 [Ascobolus immersus RN42]